MYLNQKECKPEETVQWIRAILKENKIFVRELNWLQNKNIAFSCSVACRGSSHMTNGKGITKLFALASGYAEYMERLQTCFFLESELLSFPDERFMRLDKIIDTPDIISQKNISNSVMVLYPGAKKRKFQCIPYYHYNSRKVKYLPHDLIQGACGANGLCAGNSLQEALVQGLSEVFERHVTLQIFLNPNINLPVVPEHKVRKLSSYSLIQAIEKRGYKVLVKDCSLSGRFPVAACFILNKDLSQYYFHLGASPILDTAVQRCITEACQGRHLFNPKSEFDIEPRKYMFSDSDIDILSGGLLQDNFFKQDAGNGDFPSSIIHAYGKDYTEQIFLKKARSNKELLRHLLKSVIDNKWDLFVRDFSYLGFPALRVYVPGVSEMRLNKEGYQQWHYIEKLEGILKTARHFDKSKLERFMNDLIVLVLPNLPFFKGLRPKKNIRLLLIYICLRLKRYDLAWKYALQYKEFFMKRFEENTIPLMRCFIMAIKLKAHRLDNKKILSSLQPIYGHKLVQQVLRDIAEAEKHLVIDRIDFEARLRETDKFIKDFTNRMIQKTINQAELDKAFYPSLRQ